MQTLRTPDDRFANVPEFPYTANYCEVSDDDGGSLRMAAMWLSTDLGGAWEETSDEAITWGSGNLPTTISSPAPPRLTISIGFTLRGDRRGSLQDHFNDFKAILLSGDLVYIGLEHERLFGKIKSPTWRRGATPGTIAVKFSLAQTAFDEGETPNV